MYLDQYNQESLGSFGGWYSRGTADECPPDHFQTSQNIAYSRKTGFGPRPGTKSSIATGHSVVRGFMADFTTATYLITCDGAGNLYKTTTGAVPVTSLLINIVGMVDFTAINMFNHCFILPIGTSGSNLLILNAAGTIRAALGQAPSASFTATVGAASSGNISSGVHNFAICYVTDSGFTTQPGPVIAGVFTPVSVTFPDATRNLVLTGVPTGPTGTTQRVILGTKSGLLVYYFIPNGTINDNVTTTITLNFYDTDLAVDASDQFNLKTSITSTPTGYGGAGLAIYHGRLVICDGITPNAALVSYSGQPEAFSNVTGFINIGFQEDQTISAFEYFGTLYVSQNVGIIAFADNGQEPSSWVGQLINIENGFPSASLTNVYPQKGAGPMSGLVLGLTREGLFAFNGNVVRPYLSWKIGGYWANNFTHGAEHSPAMTIDFTRDMLYIVLPTGGSTTPNILIAGDFSSGMDPQNIQWSLYTFPFTPQCIFMADYNDGDDFDYWLRIGTATGVQKLTTKATDDSGTAITSIAKTYLKGNRGVSVFRHMQMRFSGTGTLSIGLEGEDGAGAVTLLPTITLSSSPGKDIDRPINFTNEKMAITFTFTSGSYNFNRLDLYSKTRWMLRPA